VTRTGAVGSMVVMSSLLVSIGRRFPSRREAV
jgi:hypothetical protein